MASCTRRTYKAKLDASQTLPSQEGFTKERNSMEDFDPRLVPDSNSPLPHPRKSFTVSQSWSTLRDKSNVGELSNILESETGLLSGLICRKGTQLRLEKALMLSNRIHKLGKRWLANKLLHEFALFDDGVQLSLNTKGTPKGQRKTEEGIRLPSRQWANWIMYLTLRDCLILAKIKDECERTVKYWLGLISSSHHATDSLVAVGILSRIWYVSSSMVHSLINVMYPTVCKLSIHLEPTKAENWLTDLEIPSPEDLNSWLEGVLGSPFVPARLSKGLDTISQGSVTEAKMESLLRSSCSGDSKSIRTTRSAIESLQTTPVVSATTVHHLMEAGSDEDLGEPVVQQSKRAKLTKKTSMEGLNEKWTRFFAGYKTKLKNDKGKKQFCVRIRKYLKDEKSKKVVVRLKKLRQCIKTCSYDEIVVMINQFQKFLSKQISC